MEREEGEEEEEDEDEEDMFVQAKLITRLPPPPHGETCLESMESK